MCECVCGSQRMNSALVLFVQVRRRAVSAVMGTHGSQETALSQGAHACVCMCVCVA